MVAKFGYGPGQKDLPEDLAMTDHGLGKENPRGSSVLRVFTNDLHGLIVRSTRLHQNKSLSTTAR